MVKEGQSLEYLFSSFYCAFKVPVCTVVLSSYFMKERVSWFKSQSFSLKATCSLPVQVSFHLEFEFSRSVFLDHVRVVMVTSR